MNKVYRKGSDKPLTPRQLANEANKICRSKVFKASDFDENNPYSRISGDGHCYCEGNGEFVLLDSENEAVKEGGKRYMVCRKCGGWSHL